MAKRAVHLDRETFSCSICLELLKDPVTIPCGHSYCRSCIRQHWDEEEERGINSCPQCRKVFVVRPQLLKNTMLAALLDELKKTGLQDAPADHCYAGAEDVACDVCTGRKLKALKSCLVCLASYCDTHLQPHRDAAPLKKHQLVEPSKNLQENICSRHHKLMEIFCRFDQQCICYLCSMDEHKGHDTIPAAAERREKQEELQKSRQTIQRRIQYRERNVKVLQQEVTGIIVSADEAVEHSQEIFSQLIRLVERKGSDVKQQIRSQQEAELSRVKELQEKLEQEITELKNKDAGLQQLSHSEDHCHFLHNYPAASQLSGSTHSSRTHIHPRLYFEGVTAALSDRSQELKELLGETWTNISLTPVDVLPQAEPITRADFLRYSCDITLDPNTACTYMLLSEDNKSASWTENYQSYPDHPDRFSDYCQVLSQESLTGRCYWEVKLNQEGAADVAVVYNSVSRAGEESEFGFNNKSWTLNCDYRSYAFWHDGYESPVAGPWSSTVGVYLDHPAGVLSFYSVSDTMTLLHRTQTTFTQSLHAALYLSRDGSIAELVKPE